MKRAARGRFNYPLFSLSVSEFLDVNEHGAAADLY